MFRSPQILGFSCPIRPLLFRVRDLRTPTTTICTRTNGAGAEKPVTVCLRDAEKTRREGRRTDGGISYLKETSTCPVAVSSSSLDCETFHLKARTQQNFIPHNTLSDLLTLPKDSSSSKLGDGRTFTHCKSILDLAQNPKSLNLDSLNNVQCLQPQIKPWDTSQPLHCNSMKMQSSPIQSHFCHRGRFLRSFFSSTQRQWALADFHKNHQLSSLYADHIRALHHAGPHLTSSLRDYLSPENEERCRLSLRPNLKLYEGDKGKRKAGQSQGKGQGRWASVLVSLCSVEGEPAFLFTLRSSTLKGRHKGDVSFAGGKSDPSDGDVVATALREAQEELGITVATESIWGVLKPLRDMSGMVIAPVLANLGPIEALSFKPNPGEVEEIFTLSLSHLCNPQNRGYTHFRTGDKYGYTLPVFCNGKHRVWGLTAVALSHTLNLLNPP